jgi:uncharacterized protein
VFIGITKDFLKFFEIFRKSGEKMLKKNKYEGIYQIASFHPNYLFEGSTEKDAANYTNRSPYPMLHILREDSITKAIEFYKDVDRIPERNIEFAREKGVEFFNSLLASLPSKGGFLDD